jgi:catalase
MLRDGFHQHAVHGGVAPYKPNSLAGGCPFFAGGGARDGAFVDVPAHVAESVKTREAPASYDDHFSQVRQFWLSMTAPEKEHIAAAYTFELAKCFEQAVKERQLLALANIDPELCAQVAAGLGLPVPDPTEPLDDLGPSPALSQLTDTDWPSDGRVIGIVVDPDGELAGIDAVREAVTAAGMVPLVVAPYGGKLSDGTTVQRTFGATRSVEFDAVLVAGSPVSAADALAVRDSKAGEHDEPWLDPRVVLLLQECFRHAKAIGAWGAGAAALEVAGVPDAAGVFTSDDPAAVFAEVHTALGAHRVWERFDLALSRAT